MRLQVYIGILHFAVSNLIVLHKNYLWEDRTIPRILEMCLAI